MLVFATAVALHATVRWLLHLPLGFRTIDLELYLNLVALQAVNAALIPLAFLIGFRARFSATGALAYVVAISCWGVGTFFWTHWQDDLNRTLVLVLNVALAVAVLFVQAKLFTAVPRITMQGEGFASSLRAAWGDSRGRFWLQLGVILLATVPVAFLGGILFFALIWTREPMLNQTVFVLYGAFATAALVTIQAANFRSIEVCA